MSKQQPTTEDRRWESGLRGAADVEEVLASLRRIREEQLRLARVLRCARSLMRVNDKAEPHPHYFYIMVDVTMCSVTAIAQCAWHPEYED